MTEISSFPSPGSSPEKRYNIDPDPLREKVNGLVVPGDPLEIDPGKETPPDIGDDNDELGNAHEKPHETTLPSS